MCQRTGLATASPLFLLSKIVWLFRRRRKRAVGAPIFFAAGKILLKGGDDGLVSEPGRIAASLSDGERERCWRENRAPSLPVRRRLRSWDARHGASEREAHAYLSAIAVLLGWIEHFVLINKHD